MIATDDAGMARSFLATEENFAVIKDLHSRNLIVPVVGNFAGPKAIRAVGKYVRARGATVGGLLRLERRAVPEQGGRAGGVLRQRVDAAARWREHVHPQRAGRLWSAKRRHAATRRIRRRLWRQLQLAASQHADRTEELHALAHASC